MHNNKLKYRFIILAISFVIFTCSFAFAQDPETLIYIHLLKDGKIITSPEYKISFRKTSPYYNDSLSQKGIRVPVKYDTSYSGFHIFYYGPYIGHQILELTITHFKDSMRVRIKKNTFGNDINELVEALFCFDIPFQKGYYEITDLVYTAKGYAIMENYKWINLSPNIRKLIIKD
jgi:hypothetical protein